MSVPALTGAPLADSRMCVLREGRDVGQGCPDLVLWKDLEDVAGFLFFLLIPVVKHFVLLSIKDTV